MTVCCVIVTYGDRYDLLTQVVEAVFRENVDQIIIVNNGSLPNSRQKMELLSKAYFPRLTIHDFEKNRGSAPGFHKGLELAASGACDFIWMMDDDNKPAPGALAVLKSFYKENIPFGKQDITALCSLRKNRPNFMDALEKNNPDLILQTRNNFAGFHIKTLLSKIGERIFKPAIAPVSQQGVLKIDATCYGGLFFHKNLINRIGLPDVSYVLYADDFAYTYQIPKLGGEIWLIAGSEVMDIESSFYLPKKKSLLYHSVFDGGSDTSIYYSFRNSIYFSDTYLLTNRATRFINKIIFLTIITGIGLLRGNMHRLDVLHEAIRDAENRQLGEKAKYVL